MSPERRVTVVLGADVAPYVSNIARADDITIRLEGNLKSVGRTSDQVAGTVTRGSDEIHRGFSRSALAASLMNGNLKQVALTAAGFFSAQFFVQGTQKIVSSIKSVITAGADWTESITKTQFAFGDASQLIIGQAEEMAKRLGVDKQVFVDNATAIGLIGKAAGLSAPAAAAMGANFARLAVDASSFYNVPVADALGAIQSGLVGQERPLRQYGVLLDAASVSAEAVSLGLSKTGANLSQGQAVMARASLITKGFADASGDLERTQGSLANRFRAISGDIHNFEISLGDRLRPVLLAVLDTMGRLGSQGLDVLSIGAAALSPFLHNLVAIGRDLGTMFASTAHAAAPIVGAFAAIAGTPIVATLNAVSSVLRPIADLLAHNQVAADALAAVLIARLIPALAGFATSAVFGTIGPWIAGLGSASGATAVLGTATAVTTEQLALFSAATAGETELLALLDAAEASTATTSGFLSGALGSAGAALAQFGPLVAIGAFLVLGSQIAKSKTELDGLVKSTSQGLDLHTGAGLQSEIDRLKALSGQADDASKHYTGLLGTLEKIPVVRDIPLVSSLATAEAQKSQDKYNQTVSDAQAILRTYNSNLASVERQTGLTKDQVEHLAEANKVDLTSANGAAIASFIQLIFAAQSAGTAMDDAAKARQDALTSANKAQLDSSNILSTIVTRHNELDAAQKKSASSGETESERQNKIAAAYLGVESAQQHVLDSRKKLDDLRNGGQARELLQAERDVENSYAATQRAVMGLLDATRSLEDARRQAAEGRTVAEAEIAVGRAIDKQAQNVMDLAKAQDKLNYAREVGIPEEIAQSEREYNEVLRQQKEDGFAAEDAQVALGRAKQDSLNGNRAVITAQMDYADATRNVASSQDQQAEAVRKLNELLDGGLAREMAAADLELRQAVLGVGQAEDGVAAALKKTSDNAETQAQKFDESKVSLGEYMKQLEDFIASTSKWDGNLVLLQERARKLGVSEAIVSEFRDLGPKMAPLLDQLLGSSDETFTRLAGDVGEKSRLMSDGFVGNLDTMIQLAKDGVTLGGQQIGTELQGALTREIPGLQKIAANLGVETVNSLIGQLGAGTAGLDQVVADYGRIIAKGANAVIGSFGGKPVVFEAPKGAVSIQSETKGGRYETESGAALIGGYAAGGIDAHIVSSPTILYGERETGGAEAFIPRSGNPGKMKEVMATAASWYGMRVVPMAAGGISAPPILGSGSLQLAASAVMNNEYRQALDAVAKKMSQAKSPVIGVVSADIAAWFSQAVALAKKDPSWISGLEAIAKAESNFNPMAVNPVAVGKEHATGVMQMLPSTFRAHALPGHGDIYNPVDNIASAEGYIAGRYGTPENTPLFKGGPYKGYAAGGIFVHSRPWDTGGTEQPGWNAFYNGTGRQLPVAPVMQPAMAGGGRPPITIHMPVTITNQGGITVPELLDQVETKVTAVGQRVIDTITDEMEHH